MTLQFFIIKNKIKKLFDNIFSKNDLVLDIGCGSKPYYHKNIKAKIICADIKKTKKTQVVCDSMAIPLKKSKFDGIVCVNSLYYYDDPFAAINEFFHVLKKNGKLVIVTPFMYPIHDIPNDKFRFTEYGIRKLLKDNFDVKEIKTVGGIFNIPAVFFHSLIKGLPLMAQKNTRKVVSFFTIIVFYPFYLLAQLFSLLDFLDKSRRWPTYYFTIATRK